MARVAPDAADILVWRLNETSGAYRSTGSTSPNTSTTDLIVAGTIDRVANGIYGDTCANFPGTTDFPTGTAATRNYAVGAATINPQPPLSVSAWILLRSYNNASTKHIVGKLFRDHATTNNYATPFNALEMSMATGNVGTDLFFQTVSTSFVQTGFTITDFPIPLMQWSHIGLTHDGTSLRAYLNGNQLMTYSGTTQLLQQPVNSSMVYNDVTYGVVSTSGATYVPGVDDIGNHGDEVRTQITFPFPVTIYGSRFTTGFVGSNGTIEFGQNTAGFSFTLPNASFGNLLCVFQKDQTTTAPQGIFTTTTGTSPNRVFIVEWRNKMFSDSLLANYEVKFFENTNAFEFLYTTSTTSGTACIGVQSAAGAVSTIFSNATAMPAAGTKLTFTPTVTSTSGGWYVGAVPPYLSVSSANKEEGNCMIQDVRVANVARPLSYFQNIYKVGVLPINLAIVTQYYKMRAYDLSCVTPTPVTWIDSVISYANAPAFPCGGPYSDIEIVDSWFG